MSSEVEIDAELKKLSEELKLAEKREELAKLKLQLAAKKRSAEAAELQAQEPPARPNPPPAGAAPAVAAAAAQPAPTLTIPTQASFLLGRPPDSPLSTIENLYHQQAELFFASPQSLPGADWSVGQRLKMQGIRSEAAHWSKHLRIAKYLDAYSLALSCGLAPHVQVEYRKFFADTWRGAATAELQDVKAEKIGAVAEAERLLQKEVAKQLLKAATPAPPPAKRHKSGKGRGGGGFKAPAARDTDVKSGAGRGAFKKS